jgi:hypothetical protein
MTRSRILLRLVRFAALLVAGLPSLLAAQTPALRVPSAPVPDEPALRYNASQWLAFELAAFDYKPMWPSLPMQRVFLALGWSPEFDAFHGASYSVFRRPRQCPKDAPSATEPCESWDIIAALTQWGPDSTSVTAALALGTVMAATDSDIALPLSREVVRDSAKVMKAFAESSIPKNPHRCKAWVSSKPPQCTTFAP